MNRNEDKKGEALRYGQESELRPVFLRSGRIDGRNGRSEFLPIFRFSRCVEMKICFTQRRKEERRKGA